MVCSRQQQLSTLTLRSPAGSPAGWEGDSTPGLVTLDREEGELRMRLGEIGWGQERGLGMTAVCSDAVSSCDLQNSSLLMSHDQIHCIYTLCAYTCTWGLVLAETHPAHWVTILHLGLSVHIHMLTSGGPEQARQMVDSCFEVGSNQCHVCTSCSGHTG